MKEQKYLYQIKTLEKSILRILISDMKNHNHFIKAPTPTQHQIMHYIIKHRHEDIYQKDLESVLNIRRATVSGVLKTMDKNGLIERIVDTKDTRTKKIILNKNALKLFSSNEELLNKLENIITEDIDEKDLEVFSKVVDKMINNINKMNKDS